MPPVSVNVSTSSAALNPVVIWIVAPDRSALSMSVIVTVGATTTAGPSSLNVAAPETNSVGASLIGLTVMSTWAGAEVEVASETVKVKLAAPSKSARGSKMTRPRLSVTASLAAITVPLVVPSAVWNRVPLEGIVTMVKLSPVLSTSVPVSVIVWAPSSSTETACTSATGASSTAMTLTVVVSTVEAAPSKSVTVKVTVRSVVSGSTVLVLR